VAYELEKNENDRVKNLLDLYKVQSEEMRHSASIIWQYQIAILTFQSLALGLAFKESGLGPKLALMIASFISIGLSVMLIRQAHDRRSIRKRIVETEVLLRPIFGECFKEFEGPFKDFTSVDLSWWICTVSLGLLAVSVAWFVGTIVYGYS
jgi:hypothetical protein